MIEENLPNKTYEEGIRELYPDFLLTTPLSIHIQIFDVCIDALYPQYSYNRDVAAGVLSGDPTNPKLMIFLPTLEVAGSLIKWTNYRETFKQVIIHEFLHLYGDLRKGVVDGRIRHNHSASEPYNEEQEISQERINAWMDHFGMNKFQCHCSGHASSKDLLQIVDEINASTLYPVHTEHPEI
jgi:Zn-dependent metallo-hydrolase RNA specificity domain